jgi:ketosteroid isomerase-like protein
MSEENVELALESVRRFKPDLDEWAKLWHPETRLSVPEEWPEPGPFIGLEAVRRQFEQGFLIASDFRIEDVEVVADSGPWVVLTYRAHAEGATSGLELDFNLAATYRVQDGLLSEVHLRWGVDEALQAAGLSE